MYKRIVLLVMIMLVVSCGYSIAQKTDFLKTAIELPEPKKTGGMSVEEAINNRKSTRKFSDAPLNLQQISQLLWAAGGTTVDGITGATRAFPSAGAIYPEDIYLVAGNVKGLEPGVYKYDWAGQRLLPLKRGDFRAQLAKASLSRKMVEEAPAVIVVTAQYAKTARIYGQRGIVRYVAMDTGHLGQNVHLQAEAMGLGTVMIGAFIDRDVIKVIGVKNEMPVYVMPVGEKG